MLKSLDFLIEEPADVYHKRRAVNLSSHALADFRRCPLLFWRKERGLIPDFDSSSYKVGRAAHTLILEGRKKYERTYAIGGPINEKTGKPYGSTTKKFAEWMTEQECQEALTESQALCVELMETSIFAHKEAKDLISDGKPEGVVRTKYLDVPCQIRCDWFHPKRGLVDLKTCADLSNFEKDCSNYGYGYQLAFYRAIIQIVTNHIVPVHIVAVEKQEPYRVGVWSFDDGLLDHYAVENERAIMYLKHARDKNDWPTHFEKIRRIITM